jgi:hypothetical protein
LGVVWGPNLLWKSSVDIDTSDPLAIIQLMMESGRVNAVAETFIRVCNKYYYFMLFICYSKEFDDIFSPVPSSNIWASPTLKKIITDTPLVNLGVLAPINLPGQYHLWTADNCGAVTSISVERGDIVNKFDTGQGVIFKMATIGHELWTTSKSSLCIWSDSVCFMFYY